jgi:uncharacterized protein YndB with AHSA1/START domain
VPRYEATVDISAPADKVWAVLTAVERWPEWTPSMAKLERLDAGELAVGSRVRIRQPKLPVAVWRVTALEPGRCLEWQYRSPLLLAVGSHAVKTNVSGGTTVTLVLEQNGLLTPLLTLLYGGLTRRYVEMEAQGLKRRCESVA